MDLEKKAQEFLKSREDLNECLITSDGNVFLAGNKDFAQSHAQKLGDNKVVSVKKAKKENKPKKEKSAKSKD